MRIQKKQGAASRKKPAARADEVAAFDLPHPGPEFAELRAEFRAMPKQVKKPMTSLRRLLATLGKYAEGFACQLLDKAIQGAWSGVEFDGTAKAYTEWQAEQARRPPPYPPARPAAPATDSPALNHELLARWVSVRFALK